MDKLEIVAVRKDHEGILTKARLSDGREVPRSQLFKMVESGELYGYTIAHRNDNEFLRSNPDMRSSNNLQSLPRF